MQEREAAVLLATGIIDSAVIYRPRTETGEAGLWELHFAGPAGTWPRSSTRGNVRGEVLPKLETARGGIREFATLDAAWNALERLRPDARPLRVSIDG